MSALPLLDWRPPATKQAALEQHERLRSEWLDDARRVARELGADGSEIHVRQVRAEMIRRGLHDPHDAASESRFGAVFCMKDGWRAVGWATYSDAERNCHSKPIRVWRLRRPGEVTP